MVEAGYVADVREAFDRWLTVGAPAFVERAGASAEDVIEIIHRAGGLVSLAHPGRTRIDERIAALKDAGLDALEVFHSDHDDSAILAYQDRARRLGLLMTGGSDFHGDPTHGLEPGASHLPQPEWAALRAAGGSHGGQ
jgi:predicted metal-dependent phosphoesterase TrpH